MSKLCSSSLPEFLIARDRASDDGTSNVKPAWNMHEAGIQAFRVQLLAAVETGLPRAVTVTVTVRLVSCVFCITVVVVIVVVVRMEPHKRSRVTQLSSSSLPFVLFRAKPMVYLESVSNVPRPCAIGGTWKELLGLSEISGFSKDTFGLHQVSG